MIIRYCSPVPISQTIDFPAIPTRTTGESFALNVTASSGLPVSLRVVSGSAVLQGTTLAVGLPGNVTVTATQNGGLGYTAATPITRTFSVVKANQTVTFPPIASQTLGASVIQLGATASTALPISYSVTSGPAVILGSSLTATGGGSVTVVATQAGNEYYNAASANQTFSVVADTVPPSPAPVLSVSSVAANSVVLSWTASTDAISSVSYEVIRNGSVLFVLGKTATTVTGLSAQTAYTFQIRAKDTAGNLAPSNTVNATTTAAGGAGDTDDVPPAVELLLGTNPNVTGVNDSTNQMDLKSHSPKP